jgi:hypothetical protein
MYAGSCEIGLRGTEKILRVVQCCSKQVAQQWVQSTGTSGIRAKGAASGDENRGPMNNPLRLLIAYSQYGRSLAQ